MSSSLDEVRSELRDIKKMLLEMKAAFDRFTTEKKQQFKDEQARRREKCW